MDSAVSNKCYLCACVVRLWKEKAHNPYVFNSKLDVVLSLELFMDSGGKGGCAEVST